MVCNPGSAPVGKRRIFCRESENGHAWSDPIGECKTCQDPILPSPRNVHKMETFKFIF